MPPTSPKLVTGPPCELISRIDYLRDLLKNLLSSLPKDLPNSHYQFYLDLESIDLCGYFGAAGHRLEIAFQTFTLGKQPLVFLQRGSCIDDLPKLLKLAVKQMSDGERENFRTAWIKHLIRAAKDSGAKIPAPKCKAVALTTDSTNTDPALLPAKKAKGAVMVVDDSESDCEPNTHSPSPLITPAIPPPAPPPRPNPPTQKTTESTFAAFGWKKASPEEVKAQWRKVREENEDKRKEKVADDERREEEKKQHTQELATLRKRREHERKAAAKDTDIDAASSTSGKSEITSETIIAQERHDRSHSKPPSI
ncbi:hypothetical protein DFH08DRAFT_969285 [Mycena albidolilacea]|uniref:Uncharacterized protein n=1 Tax=Mycena albidolilacea TaxID=1033008 RepID=A0AAD6ZHD1_9AGAR|nr:hypothetical protein DFH08DRAFT_969285 [Mycena albidolilacea]